MFICLLCMCVCLCNPISSPIDIQYGGYDSGSVDQTTCKGYASSINKAMGLEAVDYRRLLAA